MLEAFWLIVAYLLSAFMITGDDIFGERLINGCNSMKFWG